jgi:hypothetical protein
MSDGARDRVRPLAAGMRRTLYLTAATGLVAFVQLFVGTEDTDRYFAWTIEAPLTAAFFGALYATAVVLVLLAARERTWAGARVAATAAVIIVPLITVVTFAHIDAFHTDSDSTFTQLGTWAFIGTYIVASALLITFVAHQLRLPGGDPPRAARLPAWARATLVGQAAVFGAVGVALLVAPGSAGDIWPWPLTDLTGRITGAWALAIAIAAGTGAWEDDWRRLRAPCAAYVVLPFVSAVALARYSDAVEWGDVGIWALGAALLSMLAVGVAGRPAARAAGPPT